MPSKQPISSAVQHILSFSCKASTFQYACCMHGFLTVCVQLQDTHTYMHKSSVFSNVSIVHSPTTLNVMLSLALSPSLVVVQVWVPVSPEWTAIRVITLVAPFDEVMKLQPEQVDVHT